MKELTKEQQRLEKIEKIKKEYVGKRVKIVEPNHPWMDEIGIFKDIEYFGCNKWGIIVELTEQCGHECTVFSGRQGIKII